MSWLHMPCQAIFSRVMPYFCVSCRVINIPCHAVSRFLILAPTKMFLLGGCRPPDPPLFLGGFQPPRPPGGGLAAPCAPLHTERLRLSGSPFFLVPRSWYQNLGSGSWYQVACRVPNVACHAVSIPFVSKSSVSCRVINLRVGVSVPCRGHPDCTIFVNSGRRGLSLFLLDRLLLHLPLPDLLFSFSWPHR